MIIFPPYWKMEGSVSSYIVIPLFSLHFTHISSHVLICWASYNDKWHISLEFNDITVRRTIPFINENYAMIWSRSPLLVICHECLQCSMKWLNVLMSQAYHSVHQQKIKVALYFDLPYLGDCIILMHVTYSAHFIPLDFITLIIFGPNISSALRFQIPSFFVIPIMMRDFHTHMKQEVKLVLYILIFRA